MREKFVGVGQMREKKFVWGRGQIQSPPHSDPPGGVYGFVHMPNPKAKESTMSFPVCKAKRQR